MRLIKITRSDISDSYVMPLEAIDIQAADVSTSVTLTVVEMTEEEYALKRENMEEKCLKK